MDVIEKKVKLLERTHAIGMMGCLLPRPSNFASLALFLPQISKEEVGAENLLEEASSACRVWARDNVWDAAGTTHASSFHKTGRQRGQLMSGLIGCAS